MATFSNESNGEDSLTPDAKVRIAVLDVIVPAGFIAACIKFTGNDAVKRFRMFSLIFLVYIADLVLAILLHIIMTATNEIKGQYRIMIAGTFVLTEGFNMFLIMLYRSTASRLIGAPLLLTIA